MTTLIERSFRSEEDLEKEIEELEKEGGIFDEEKETPPVEKEERELDTPPVNPEDESWKKRYGDLRRVSQKQAAELKELKEKLESVKAGSEVPKNLEQAKKWAEENPQAAAIIKALAKEELKTSFDPKAKDFDKLKEEIEREREQTKIRKVHPDFDELVESEEFHNWAETQPKRVQDLIYEGGADDVIWAIGAYKKEALNAKQDPDKEAARSVGKKGISQPTEDRKGFAFKESEIAKMPISEYEKHEEAILKAMREGRFLYDLTGGAR